MPLVVTCALQSIGNCVTKIYAQSVDHSVAMFYLSRPPLQPSRSLSLLPTYPLVFQTNRCRAKHSCYSFGGLIPLCLPLPLLIPLLPPPSPCKCQPSHPLLSKAPQSQQDPPKPDCSSHIIQPHTKKETGGTARNIYTRRFWGTN